MPDDIDEISVPLTMIQTMLANVISVLLKDCQANNHTPEWAVVHTSKVIKAAMIKACDLAAIPEDCRSSLEFES